MFQDSGNSLQRKLSAWATAFVLLAAFFPISSKCAGPPPVINAQPADATALAGTAATFTIAATSSTTLSYQWRKNEVNISGATSSSYTIPSVNRSDAGEYSVKLVNGGGTVYSSNATLIVLSPPEITSQPVNQTVVPGENVALSVNVAGTAPLVYSWYYNGSFLGEGTDSVLARNNFQMANAGEYFVVVSNIYGVTTSSVATINLQSWVATYNGTKEDIDYLQAMVIDSAGNVYVTGYAMEIASSDTYDFVTIKYDPTGRKLWRAVYDGGVDKNDQAVAIAIDSTGNVYVAGSSELSAGAGGWDYLTVKYDNNGNQLWTARFNGAGNNEDFPTAIGTDKSGNVVVTGRSKNASGKFQYCTIKYNSVGTPVWLKTYSNSTEDAANSLALDSFGNVYVTGKSKSLLSGFDVATIKYSSDGTEAWTVRYSGDLLKDDIATKVALDAQGNVYVTGYSQGLLGSLDYLTLKYSSSGSQLWKATYNGPANKIDQPVDITVDNSGNVFVTGSSEVTAGKSDYATVKYNSAGQQLWASRYNGYLGEDDQAAALAVDSAGNVYVTGKSKGNGSGYDFATVKYAGNNGSEKWVARYSSPDTHDDAAVALAVDSDFSVYVAGQANDKLDYTLVKYQPTVLPPAVLVAPQNQNLEYGQRLTLSVSAGGSRPLAYQWSRNGTLLNDATNSTLIVEQVRTSDAGLYSVTITNGIDSTSATASALVQVTMPLIQLSISGSQPAPQSGIPLNFSVPQGAIYEILASSDAQNWVAIATNTGTGATITFSDPAAGNYPMRFYRVRAR